MNIETIQLVIIASLSIITVLITIIGIQTIFLLKDVSKIVKRADYISSGLLQITKVLEKSLTEMRSFAEGATLVIRFFDRLVGKKLKDGKK